MDNVHPFVYFVTLVIQGGAMAKFWPLHHYNQCMGENRRKTLGTARGRGGVSPIYYGELYSDFPQRLCTYIIPQMQKTCPILAWTKYSKISSFYKKGHPLRVEDTYIWRALQ